jgi:6-phosphogluconolactonase
VLALAGGRTPFPVYRRLAEAALDWSRVVLLATDERWVDIDHPASNTREIIATFARRAGVRVLPLDPLHPALTPTQPSATMLLR